MSLGYGDRILVRGIDLEITRGARIGVAGPNGSGKSTLLRSIVGEVAPIEGHIDRGRGVVPAYFSQIRTDLPPAKASLKPCSTRKGS